MNLKSVLQLAAMNAVTVILISAAFILSSEQGFRIELTSSFFNGIIIGTLISFYKSGFYAHAY